MDELSVREKSLILTSLTFSVALLGPQAPDKAHELEELLNKLFNLFRGTGGAEPVIKPPVDTRGMN